ncbi:hypothetical protein [Streptomyces albidoflavus]|uniref:hypothetical protein n=1 Tax=Streptomyces albidoflavus TaxID=1886 RepID=UPI00331FC194
MHDDTIPDADDLLQEEEVPAKMTAIPVVVEGPARVQLLPTRSAGMRSWPLTADQVVRVLDADPRRRRAVLQAVGGAVRLGTSQAAARVGAQIAEGTLLTLTTCDEVWATAALADTELSIINEQWAE